MYIKGMKRYILGINLPIKAKCHESGVALIDDDGNVVLRLPKNDFQGKKLDGDFPELSIKKCWNSQGIKKEEVAYVVDSIHKQFWQIFSIRGVYLQRKIGVSIKAKRI